MEKKRSFNILFGIEIMAIFLLMTAFFGTQAERELFDGVSEFVPVNAKCVNSFRTGSNSYSIQGQIDNYNGYNNTYQYEVNGKTYLTIFYCESSKGTDKIIYYHPDKPEVCSEFKTYWDATMHYALFTIGGLILQGIVIFFAFRSIDIRKEKTVVHQPIGVVLNDDDFFMKSEKVQSDELQKDSILFDEKKDLTQKDSVPFVKGQEMTEVDSVPFVRKKDAMQVDSVSFVNSETTKKADLISLDNTSASESPSYILYTEEEYKKRK